MYVFQADGKACALPPRATVLSGGKRGALRSPTSVPTAGHDKEVNSPLLLASFFAGSGQIKGILSFLWCLFLAPK